MCRPGFPALARAARLQAADRKSAASRCVAEALRLRVQSIDVRFAAADLTLPTSTGGTVGAARFGLWVLLGKCVAMWCVWSSLLLRPLFMGK